MQSSLFGQTGFLDLTQATYDVGRRFRRIGTSEKGVDQAEVTVEELHDDDLVITQHPVEQGAIISDHAYKLPPEVRIRCGWSNSRPSYSDDMLVSGSPTYAEEVYEQIIKLQMLREPFVVYTAKRYYEDMLVASVRVNTNPSSEYALLADITLRQVLLVSTKLSLTNASAMRSPETTKATQRVGEVQLESADLVDTQIGLALGEPPT